MAEINTTSVINTIKGKTNSRDNGYFYIRNGKQFYRTREETYQKNQSPRQKWNSAAFAYAHKQLHAIESSPDSLAQMQADYAAVGGVASNGKSYTTAHAWKFNALLYAYKTEHPYIQD